MTSLARRIKRNHIKGEMKAMNFKKRVWQYDLKDTELTVYLHNPRINDFEAYLQKSQVFATIGEIFTEMQNTKGKATIPEETKKDIVDLVCLLADVKEGDQIRAITREEVAQLSMMDCVNMVGAINSLANGAASPTVAAAPTQTEPVAAQPS